MSVELPLTALLLAIPAKELYLHGYAGCGLRIPRYRGVKTALVHAFGRFGTLGVWISSFREANTDASYVHTLLHPRQRHFIAYFAVLWCCAPKSNNINFIDK